MGLGSQWSAVFVLSLAPTLVDLAYNNRKHIFVCFSCQTLSQHMDVDHCACIAVRVIHTHYLPFAGFGWLTTSASKKLIDF